MKSTNQEIIIADANNFYQTIIASKQIIQYIDFLKKESEGNSFLTCLCFNTNQPTVTKNFKRAYNTLTSTQKVQYYAHNMKAVQILTSKSQDYENRERILDIISNMNTILCRDEQQKQWIRKQIEVIFFEQKIKFKATNTIIDLNKYLMRKSSNLTKKSLVLECVQNCSKGIETIRICNDKLQFNDFYLVFESMMSEVIKNKISRMLDGESIFNYSRSSLSQNKLFKSSNNISFFNQRQQFIYKNQNWNEKEFANQNKQIDQLILNLQSNQGFQFIKKDLLYNYKENRLRKMFQFNQHESFDSQQSFCDYICKCSSFMKWKKYLTSAKHFNSKQRQKKRYLETHLYENVSVTYFYERQINRRKNVTYYLDKEARNQFKCNGKIIYCLWKIFRIDQKVKVIVEACITHQNKSDWRMTDKFIGEMNIAWDNINNMTLNLLNQSINTEFFDANNLSQILTFRTQSIQNDEDQFKTIQNQPHITQIALEDIRISCNIHRNPGLGRLKQSYVLFPLKRSQPKYKEPKFLGAHPYFEGQLSITQKGQVLAINEQKMKLQRGVAKSVIKNFGRALFNGHGIMNISLPVQIFSNQSNLSLNCKTLAYAPLLLEKAALSLNPVDRLKYIAAFSISNFVAYIQIQKPFNPILGETFQAFIDGCPIYAEQISHHPPITAILAKGRGYTLYSQLQTMIQIKFNSGLVKNFGNISISFNSEDISKDLIRYNFPDAQMSGTLYGERKIMILDKCQFIDEKNMLFLELKFGKHKGETEYCKLLDGFEGKIVQLQSHIDVRDLKKIDKKIVKEYGLINGRWTKQVYYDQQLLFNSWVDKPFVVQPQQSPLESDSYYRKDLQMKLKNNIQAAQQAKTQMEQEQRYDRKLRKKMYEDIHSMQ